MGWVVILRRDNLPTHWMCYHLKQQVHPASICTAALCIWICWCTAAEMDTSSTRMDVSILVAGVLVPSVYHVGNE